MPSSFPSTPAPRATPLQLPAKFLHVTSITSSSPLHCLGCSSGLHSLSLEPCLWSPHRESLRSLTRQLRGKESVCQHRRQRCGFDPGLGGFPWSRKWQPVPVFLPGKFHAQRSLADYSPLGRKELDRTAQTPPPTHTHPVSLPTGGCQVCTCLCPAQCPSVAPPACKEKATSLVWLQICLISLLLFCSVISPPSPLVFNFKTVTSHAPWCVP